MKIRYRAYLQLIKKPFELIKNVKYKTLIEYKVINIVLIITIK